MRRLGGSGFPVAPPCGSMGAISSPSRNESRGASDAGSTLCILVFGYGLGSRIREAAGVPYLEFILPGLVLMSIITGSYGNTSTSLFDAKRERYIDDVLISPMTPLQMALAYVLGGVVRGLVVGVGRHPTTGIPGRGLLLGGDAA